MNVKRALFVIAAVSVIALMLKGSGAANGVVYNDKRGEVEALFGKMKPAVFSQWAPGVKTRIDTDEKIVALTLDACGGKKGNGYDRELIEFLREQKIPATLFLTSIWIDANRELASELAKDPLFEIENHGYRHKPASVNGARVYGRRGTQSPADLYDEIEVNSVKIQSLAGHRPIFYRPGTAYFDDVAVKIVYDLGYIPMNFSVVSGDAAGFPAWKIEQRLNSKVRKGSVIIAHMNHPGKRLCPAMKKSLMKLKTEGYRFVKLEEIRYRLK